MIPEVAAAARVLAEKTGRALPLTPATSCVVVALVMLIGTEAPA